MKAGYSVDINLWLHRLGLVLPWTCIAIGVVFILICITGVVLRLLQFRSLLRRKNVYLELTPSAFTSRTPAASQLFFAVLHGKYKSRRWRDKLLRRDVVFVPTIYSSRSQGIRYVIQTEARVATSLQHDITAYLPDAKAQVLHDYVAPEAGKVLECKLNRDWIFPLAEQRTFDQHDPMGYITSAMSRLMGSEAMGYQLIVTPIKPREAALLSHKILHNEDFLNQRTYRHKLLGLQSIFTVLNTILFGILDMVGEVTHPAAKPYRPSHGASLAQRELQEKRQIAKGLKPARMLGSFEEERISSVQGKLNQPLFRVSIRVMVRMDTPAETRQRIDMLKAAFSSYGTQQQSIAAKVSLPVLGRFRRVLYQRYLPNPIYRRASILSASELASLYHFPLGKESKTDNLVTSLSRTLPAPITLKQDMRLDVLLGVNKHQGVATAIGLTIAERERHMYIVGGTGSGKTTMMHFAIMQDIASGKGVAVIDPHGDLAKDILKCIPKHRIQDVIYFNPDDLDHPIGLNLLQVKAGLTGNNLLREESRITEAVVSVFRKIFSEDDSGGHRIEYVLRNTVRTAMTVKDATLFTVLKLLTNADYRKTVTDALDPGALKDFWKNELGQAGNMQRVKMSAGITSKLGRFESSPSSKFVLEQPKSTIDFDDIMNTHKILICDFAKGAIGEDTSELFGTATLALLQLAAYRRVYTDKSDRQPFYLYVDEFQNFATMSFVQMLSESRKYKLYLTMAEQSTSQQDDQQMVNIILANVGTVICFRTGSVADENVLLPLFSPFINPGEIYRLSAYNFYALLNAVHSQEPTSGQTIRPSDTEGSKETAEVVLRLSQATYTLQQKPAAKPTPKQDDEKPETVQKPKKPSKKKSAEDDKKLTPIDDKALPGEKKTT
jgi:hypothetical protein